MAPNRTAISFMLGPSDAIVFVGCTPPPVRYFSFDVDIIVRQDNPGCVNPSPVLSCVQLFIHLPCTLSSITLLIALF